jgi:hypothetical protein
MVHPRHMCAIALAWANTTLHAAIPVIIPNGVSDSLASGGIIAVSIAHLWPNSVWPISVLGPNIHEPFHVWYRFSIMLLSGRPTHQRIK